MPSLLKRRSLPLTLLLAIITLLAYCACLWHYPAFIEHRYAAKQRLWAQFLGTCDCDTRNCTESFDLTLMHGSLYDRLLAASLQPHPQQQLQQSQQKGGAAAGSQQSPQQSHRPVVQHLVWQPHKLASAYPWRLRMYAHVGLVLPRSLAMVNLWWLAASEELALAMQHLAQGVPLVLDPDSQPGMRVEPDAVMRCTLEESDTDEADEETEQLQPGSGQQDAWEAEQKEQQDNEEEAKERDAGSAGSAGSKRLAVQKGVAAREAEPDASGGGAPGAAAPAGADADADADAGAAAAASDAASAGSAAAADGRDASAPTAPPVTAPPRAAGKLGGGSGGSGGSGGKRTRRGPRPDRDLLLPFRCVLLEARGRMPLLNVAASAPPSQSEPRKQQQQQQQALPGPAQPGGASPLGQQRQQQQQGEGECGVGSCSEAGSDASQRTCNAAVADAEGGGGGSGAGRREVAGSCAAAAPCDDPVSLGPAGAAGPPGDGAVMEAEAEAGAQVKQAGSVVVGDAPAGTAGVGETQDAAGLNTAVAAADVSNYSSAGGNGSGGLNGSSSSGSSSNVSDSAGGSGRGQDRAGGDKGRRGRRGRSGSGANSGGGRSDPYGGASSTCRNVIFVRPPQRAEVSEHVRDTEASPLGLPLGELLRRLAPRAAELAGWMVLPHVMVARYVLLLSPPAPAAVAGAPGVGPAPGGGGQGGGGGAAAALPLMHVGTQLMLGAGALLTLFELQLWCRVAAELLSLRRPQRSWARRRMAAWRVVYEGMVQPLREALLSWNITHFVALPLLRLALPAPALDMALLLPLAYCVGVLGAGNSDVAARASAALLRVARRVRHHEGGYHLLLLSVVEAADPRVVPAPARLLLATVMDTVGPAGRAAVTASLIEEAPGLAAALAAAAQRREHAAAAAAAGGAGGGGADGEGGAAAGGGELAAAMQAQVAPAAERGRRAAGLAAEAGAEGDVGAGAAEEGEEYDSEDEEEEEGRPGGPVVLRWPAPLKLPAEVADWEDVPRGFTCAITQAVMLQPAMLVSPDLPSAPTYERAAIQQWLTGQMRDPKSNTPLRSYSLLPNEDLHRAIDDWVQWRVRTEAAAAARRQQQRQRRQQPPGGGSDNGEEEEGPSHAAGGYLGGSGSEEDVEQEEGQDGCSDEEEGRAASTSTGGGCRPPGAGRPRGNTRGRKSGRSGGGGASRSTSVLASLANGASCLLDTGMEVMSGAAAAAATAVAAAATAAVAGGDIRRRGRRAGGAGGTTDPAAGEALE